MLQEVLYHSIKLVMRLLSLISRERISVWARWVGTLWFAVDKHHRTIAMENLAIAYGDTLDEKGRDQLVKANFIQFARVFLEIPSLLKLNEKNLHQFVTIKGRRHVLEALKSGKGVAFLTAHMGNWELVALAISISFRLKVHGVTRPIDSPAADRVLTEIRTRTGNRLIQKWESKDEISRLLREGETVGILLDQNASWYEGVYVPFFGRPAGTNKGLALFALRYDTVVIPVFNHRLPDGRYEIMIEPPLNLIRSGVVSDDVVANTALFNRVIERNIRKAPDNWFWVHRRWRLKDVPEKQRKRIKNLPPELMKE